MGKMLNSIVYMQLLVSINVKWILSSSLIVLKHNGSLDMILEGIALLVSMHEETPSYSNQNCGGGDETVRKF